MDLAEPGVPESYRKSAKYPADLLAADNAREDEDEDDMNEQKPPNLPYGRDLSPRLPPSSVIALNSTKPILDLATARNQAMIGSHDDLAELIARLEQIKAMLPPWTH